MHKFIVSEYPAVKKPDQPVLYKVWFGNKFYVHKGKVLKDSVEKLLDDVFRGIRGLNCSDLYSNIVAHCKKYPAITRLTVELIANDIPQKIINKEASFYKDKNNPNSLIDTNKTPYIPEWMLKEKFKKRCEESGCITSGTVNKKTMKFEFCPNCGHKNR